MYSFLKLKLKHNIDHLMEALQITISTHLDEIDEDDTWHLSFDFRFSEDIYFTFVSDEPYCFSKEKWIVVAEGKEGISLYFGNGEGSIYPSKDGEKLVFTSHPSGAGGDVTATFQIPIEYIREKFINAIEEAYRLGFRFAE